jgi:putative ABC transport system permease protein
MQDLRWAWRALRQSPVLSAAAILSLALGMGANTALFSVVDALLLRALPVRQPDRLVTVSSGFALGHGFKAGAGMNYDMWTRMRERAVGTTSFEDGFAWAPVRVDLSGGGEMEPADALFASGGFFTTLGVPAMLGRTLTPADDQKGGGPEGAVAVISYRLWQRRFAGAAGVIGTALAVDGVRCTVVGVMPPAFFGIEVGQPFDVALPLAVEPIVRGARASLHHPSALMLTAMFRLAPGQSVETATAALRAMQPDILGLSGASPRPLPAMLKDPYVLVPAASGTSDRSGLRRAYTRPLLTILMVVVLVLLVACVNIANLLMVRAAARRHEMSVRLALGSSRWQLARQLLAESLLLSGLGAAIGVVFAMWASRLVVGSLSTPDTRVTLDLPLDWRVLGVTAVMAILTAVLFGTGPAFRASRAAPIDALRGRGEGAAAGARSGTLVVLQVALSLVLLVAAAALVSTFRTLATLPLGFDAHRILVVDVDTARAHTDPASRFTYYQQLVDTVRTVPGVAQAAASTITPFNPATKSPLFADPSRVHEQVVSPAFFATYGQDIRGGRDFDSRDSTQAPRVVIVSESYVRRFLAGRDPLAVTLESGPCDRRRGTCAIVGVVADAALGPLRNGLRPSMYFPLAQSATLGPPGRTTIAVSLRAASGSPALLASGVADALGRFDRRLSFSYRPLEQDVTAALTQERLLAMLSSFFGGLALLLSALGLYGMTAHAAARRRTEIGIRLALGATPARVLRLVLLRTLTITGLGMLAGIAASVWASRFIASLLFGVQPGSPGTIAAAGLILMVVAAVASAIPAVQASRFDPARALREA